MKWRPSGFCGGVRVVIVSCAHDVPWHERAGQFKCRHGQDNRHSRDGLDMAAL
jgi:hypothetical protein